MSSVVLKTRECSECGTHFVLSRKDKQVCSPKCERRRDYRVTKQQQETDYCPICELSAPTTKEISSHLETIHGRKLPESDVEVHPQWSDVWPKRYRVPTIEYGKPRYMGKLMKLAGLYALRQFERRVNATIVKAARSGLLRGAS